MPLPSSNRDRAGPGAAAKEQFGRSLHGTAQCCTEECIAVRLAQQPGKPGPCARLSGAPVPGRRDRCATARAERIANPSGHREPRGKARAGKTETAIGCCLGAPCPAMLRSLAQFRIEPGQEPPHRHTPAWNHGSRSAQRAFPSARLSGRPESFPAALPSRRRTLPGSGPDPASRDGSRGFAPSVLQSGRILPRPLRRSFPGPNLRDRAGQTQSRKVPASRCQLQLFVSCDSWLFPRFLVVCAFRRKPLQAVPPGASVGLDDAAEHRYRGRCKDLVKPDGSSARDAQRRDLALAIVSCRP